MDFAAIAAFVSGIGAVLSSLVALRSLRKRERADCEQRIKEIKAALREGIELRDR